MRPDRPLIAAVLLLGFGLGLIFGYCHGTAGVNAAYPFSNCSVNLCTTTTGPGALGGLGLVLLGAVLLIWTFVLALVSQFRLLVPGQKARDWPERSPRPDRPAQ